MSFTAHLQHECSSLVVNGARHRATFAWCGTATSATTAIWTMPNTKRQRLKEPSPG
jgi:hypothetical protein